MNKLIEELREKRKERDLVKQTESNLLEAVEATEEYATYKNVQENRKELDNRIAELEDQIRKDAVNIFEATGNKVPALGVAIKIFKTFRIIDPVKLRGWIENNLRDALTVDVKKVENYATKIGPVEGTEVVEEARAQIAKDL